MTHFDGRTYPSWLGGEVESQQHEHTAEAPLLTPEGQLQSPGWARRNVFSYDRALSKPALRAKEWDFYQISNGRFAVQLCFANISVGGYASAMLIDLLHPDQSKDLHSATVCNATTFFLGGRNKYTLPPKGDVPNRVQYTVVGMGEVADVDFHTREHSRTLRFSSVVEGKALTADFTMDIPEGLENITTVLPFEGQPTRFFMTTKQNCMPTSGTFRWGEETWEFSPDDTFCVLDWGRVNTPYRLVWYWGNGSAYLADAAGEKHLFGFEITWGIGDERHATETAVFYDGKAHKLGPVDVEVFPKPDKFKEPWHFVSADGRFDMTMTPFLDHHTDMNAFVMRMHCHQVHGLWSGCVTLDDGTKLEIRDMYAFCEYCENRW